MAEKNATSHTYWSSQVPPSFQHSVVIGKFCSFGAGIKFMGNSEHHTDFISPYPFGQFFPESGCGAADHAKTPPKTEIGHDVWIGNNVTVLGGVKIGNGAIIGMNSTVSRDVNPYSVVTGNPARFRKWRFSLYVRTTLLEICWWDWPIEHIMKVASILMSSDYDKLFAYAVENKLGGTV